MGVKKFHFNNLLKFDKYRKYTQRMAIFDLNFLNNMN